MRLSALRDEVLYMAGRGRPRYVPNPRGSNRNFEIYSLLEPEGIVRARMEFPISSYQWGAVENAVFFLCTD